MVALRWVTFPGIALLLQYGRSASYNVLAGIPGLGYLRDVSRKLRKESFVLRSVGMSRRREKVLDWLETEIKVKKRLMIGWVSDVIHRWF